MSRNPIHHRILQLAVFAWLALEVSARGGGGSTGGGSFGGSGSSSGSGSGSGSGTGSGTNSDDGSYPGYWPGSGSSGNRFGGSRTGAGFDVESALNYRRIHGILAALAMVLLFPIGSILLRVLPGRIGFWAHALFQAVALCVYIAAAALGIYLVRLVQIPGFGSLLDNSSTNYHPIIGLVLLVMFVIQPVIGVIHHKVYKRLQRRQIWSYLHLANGRVGITLGIINGGLGLHLAGASDYRKRVYAIVAAIMWALWMGVAVWAELRRVRRSRQATKSTAPVVTKVIGGERRESED